jgi:D-aminoacyl-tRNA deacylase
MNMRNKFLNSKIYSFKETTTIWHEYPVFILEDVAFENKKDELLINNQIYLGLTDIPLIFLDNLNFKNTNLKPDILIFASRHTSKTARPAFLVHNTGNWTNNTDFGGKPRDLSKTSALFHKAGFVSLKDQIFLLNNPIFSLDIEVTHHGPTILDVPLIFIELGSSKQEWIIDEAGELVANAIVNSIFKYLIFKKEKNQQVGLGFGGTHYAPNFNRLVTNNDVAMSFICPKYYIQELDEKLIKLMITNTLEKVDYFIIDWKGTNSEDKKHLIPLLEKFEIPIKKSKDFSTL